MFQTKYFFVLLLLLLFACTQKTAPVVDRSKIKYTKHNILNKNKYKNLQNISTASNEVKILPKETLYSIAKKHNLSPKELIEYNKLQEPYQLKAGDILKIPVVQYQIQNKDSIQSIAKTHQFSVEEIAKANNLKPPYQLKEGEKFIIPYYRNSENISNHQLNTKNIEVVEKIHKEVSEKIVVKSLDESPKISLQNNFDKQKPANTSLTNSNQPEKPTISATNNKIADDKFPKLISNKDHGFIWPLEQGIVISRFGPKSAGLYNDGINIETSTDSMVKAVTSGVVAYVGNELKGYGNLVIIKHPDNWISAYAHLKNFNVKKGQKVVQGQQIGKVGEDKKSNKTQIYFGLRKNKTAVNPESYL